MSLAVTPIYAALLGLLLIALSLRVIAVRRRERVSLGDGGDDLLARRIRAHGNFVEYAPLGLLLIAIAEASGAPAWGLHLAGVLLILGRVSHAIGIGSPAAPAMARVGGMLMTFTALLLGAVLNLWGAIA